VAVVVRCRRAGHCPLLPSGLASRVLIVSAIVNPVDAVRTGTLAVEGTTAFGAASLTFLRFTGGGRSRDLADRVAPRRIVGPLAIAMPSSRGQTSGVRQNYIARTELVRVQLADQSRSALRRSHPETHSGGPGCPARCGRRARSRPFRSQDVPSSAHDPYRV
jgi:hypothetical protein